jgi:hypothetical protein
MMFSVSSLTSNLNKRGAFSSQQPARSWRGVVLHMGLLGIMTAQREISLRGARQKKHQ